MKDDTRRNAASILDQMTEEVGLMLTLLSREASLIQSRDFEAIQTITVEKQLLASQLDETSRELQPMFSSNGKSLSTAQASDPPAQSQTGQSFSSDLDEQWSNANALLQQCKKLNESNGAGLELLARHCKRCLDFLRNQSNADQIYGPDGIEKQPGSSRSLSLA